jgi:hypothetical protein
MRLKQIFLEVLQNVSKLQMHPSVEKLLVFKPNWTQKCDFLLCIYNSNESIGFVHGKSKKKIIEVLAELRIFIDKKVIFNEKTCIDHIDTNC